MLSKKNIAITILIPIISFYFYVFYQISYKPWVSTEFTLMGTGYSNKDTRLANNRETIISHQYIVKNPPYSLKARYEMVEKFLINQGNLYPKNGAHRVNYIFSQEGWSFRGSFPYVFYIDRSYRNNPITNIEDDSGYDGEYPEKNIPYGGASGFSGKRIAKYTIDSISSDCLKSTSLIIYRPFMYIGSLVKNIEYDDDSFNERFYFFSGDYTPEIPECEGVENEGDKVIKGLRL